jgi:hypothetical protein
VLELAGKHDEAAEHAVEALDLFERKGNLVMAARARERSLGYEAAPSFARRCR